METLQSMIENSNLIYKQKWTKYKELSSIIYNSQLNQKYYINIIVKPNHLTAQEQIKAIITNIFVPINITIENINIDISRLQTIDVINEVRNIFKEEK